MKYFEGSIVCIIFFAVISYGIFKKINVYHVFIEGVFEGLKLSYRIFPPILSMILAYRIFSDSRALYYLENILTPIFKKTNLPPDILPLLIIKPLSGSGAIGIFTQILEKNGPDSYVGILAALIMGSTETIFYTLTIYLGGIKKRTRHAVIGAIFTELVAVVVALFFTNILI